MTETALKPSDEAYFTCYPQRKPTRGVMAAHYVRSEHDAILARNPDAPALAFVPFIKGTDTPNWNAAIALFPGGTVHPDLREAELQWNARVIADLEAENARHVRRTRLLTGRLF